jgi:hypothetical protein
MKSFLVALMMLSVAFATTEEEAIQLIHRIDTTAFGHTLLDTVFVELESGDPLEKLVNTLHDLEDRYIAE